MKQPLVLVGCGRWGRRVLVALRAHCQIEVRAVVDIDPCARAAAQAIAPQAHCASHLSDVLAPPSQGDIIAGYIATPSRRHHLDATELLSAGCDVLVEKPLCDSVAQAQALSQHSSDTRRLLMVGHLLRYHPAYEALIERARQGTIGKLRRVAVRRVSTSRSREVLSRLAPHDLATLYALDGSQLIHCEARQHQHEVHVSLRLASGLRAQLVLSTHGSCRQRQFCLVGDSGELMVDELDAVTPLRFVHDAVAAPAPVPFLSDGRDPLTRQLDHFIHCIMTRARPRTDANEARWTVSAIQQARAAFRAAGIAAAV